MRNGLWLKKKILALHSFCSAIEKQTKATMNFDKVKDQFHQAQDYVNKLTPKEKAVGAAAVAGSLLTAIALKKVLSRPPKAKTYDDAEVVSERVTQISSTEFNVN